MWRTNLAILARELGFKDFSDFSARFGSGWAYHLAPVIKDVGSYERYQVINGQITDRSTGEVLFLDIVKRGAKSVFATRLAMQRAQLALLN